MHGLILEKHPDTEVRLSYKMPTYQVGERSLIVGVWKHGLSLYGWEFGRDGGFSGRHGDLMGAKGTLKLTEKAAAGIDNDELAAFFRAVFAP